MSYLIHVEEQQWYYLTYSWGNKEVHTFRKGIKLQVNVTARLKSLTLRPLSSTLLITPRGLKSCKEADKFINKSPDQIDPSCSLQVNYWAHKGPSIYLYIYIYIYMCVCVCVCIYTYIYIKIVVDSGKFRMLLLYILWDDWLIFMISGIWMHPSKAWLSQLVNFKKEIWTWVHFRRKICNGILF